MKTAVLLHGQPGVGADWDLVVEALAGRVDTRAPDRPGYGRSGGGPRDVAGNTAAVLELLDDAGVDDAVIVGYSWAGAIAIDLAARHPSRVCGLVLVASVGGDAAIDGIDRLLGVPVIGDALTAGGLAMLAVPWTRRLVAPPAADRLARPDWGTFRSFMSEQRSLIRDLPAVAAAARTLGPQPVAVVIGTDDRVVSPASQERLAAALPAPQVLRVPGCGHLLPWEAPGVIADAVLEVAGVGRQAFGD